MSCMVNIKGQFKKTLFLKLEINDDGDDVQIYVYIKINK